MYEEVAEALPEHPLVVWSEATLAPGDWTCAFSWVWPCARPLPRAGASEVQTAPLVAGRRARGAEDFEPVSLGDGGESCHVRVALGRRRQDAFEGGLADFSLESLELHRCEPD